MPRNFGWFAYAPMSGEVFAPRNRAVLHGGSLSPAARLSATPLFGALAAAAIGGLTLIEPRRLGPGALAGYRVATAALSGAYTAATLPQGIPTGLPARYTDAPGAPMPALPLDAGLRTSAALAVGGITLGLAEPLEALEARIVDWLAERGVPCPRWWLAGVGAAMVAADWARDRAELRSFQRAMDEGFEVADYEPELSPVNPAVAAILDTLLQPGIPGVEALRIQLDSVQQRDADADFMTDAYLAVDPDAPRISPRQQLWPAQGRFVRDGVVFEVHLQIHEGRLESLSLMLADEMYEPDSDVDHDEAIGSLVSWPEVAELEVITETADPLD